MSSDLSLKKLTAKHNIWNNHFWEFLLSFSVLHLLKKEENSSVQNRYTIKNCRML